jgi:uncharacterized SAM-binding protein YcdF (DUF218 family)
VTPSGPRRSRRWLAAALAILLALIAVAVIPGSRAFLLRRAGRALVVDEAPLSADVIVVSVGTGAAGILEAADLVHRGVAPRVAVFTDLPTPADQELVRRGVANEDGAAEARRQLRALGVKEIVPVPTVSGTEEEGRLLAGWSGKAGFRSLVVVGSRDHSRRLRRVLQRSLNGSQTVLRVHSARFSAFDPDTWWQTRDGLRTGIVELEKLLLDLVRHPLS